MTEVSVGVVGICGARHLRRCLEALAAQQEAPPFEIVVAYDPRLEDVRSLAREIDGVRFVANEGQESPLELAARAVSESTGELVLLTEDHCVPRADWVRNLCRADRAGRAAVGGVVDVADGVSSLDWAFYFVDFFRYSKPAASGLSPSLTVCNVAYRRERLEAVRSLWERGFHETAVNEALRRRFGDLWLTADAEVTMRRHVRLRDALTERYAFGRLFGCTRVDHMPARRRLLYALASPALPLLLLGRMARSALPAPRLRGPFLRALGALVPLVLCWCWGEWLGYLTHRRPASLAAAPEAPASHPNA